MPLNLVDKKIIFNTFTQFGTRVLTILLSLLSVSLLTRYLGTEGYGNFTLVFTYISFFAIISDIGLNLIVVREFSLDEKKSIIAKATYLNLKLLLIGLSIILPVFCLMYFPYSYYLKCAIIISTFTVAIGNLSSYGTSILQSQVRLSAVAIIDLITKIITVIIAAIFISLGLGFYYIIGSVLIGNLFGLIITLYLVRDELILKLIIDRKLLIRILKMGLPIGISSFISLAYFKIDTLLLSILRPPVDVGVYGLSYKLLENILIFWGLYMASVFPLLSKYYGSSDYTNFRDLVTKTIYLLIFISLISIILGYIFAPFVMRVLGGSHFYSSIYPFRVLLFAVPLFTINNLLYNILLSFGKTSNLIFPLFLSLMVNIILNFYYIPKYSYIAASYNTIISEIITFVAYIFVLYIRFKNEAKYWNILV